MADGAFGYPDLKSPVRKFCRFLQGIAEIVITDGAVDHLWSISLMQKLAICKLFSAIPAMKKLAKAKFGLPSAFSDYPRTFTVWAFHRYDLIYYQYNQLCKLGKCNAYQQLDIIIGAINIFVFSVSSKRDIIV